MLVEQFTNNPDLEIETRNHNEINENTVPENQEILNLNPSPEAFIKSKLSLGLIEQILRKPNLTEDERQRYNEIKEEINRYNYYYIYDDVNIHDYNLIRNLKGADMEKSIKIENDINIDLNYDIEFHKIGTRCKGLKERHAILKNGKIFSSTKSNNELKDIKELKDLKDKTPFLQDAEIIKETKAENENVKSKGEWGSKTKNYRIRINYYTKPGDKNSERSSFFLYLENEESLNEVYILLCKMRLSFIDKESLKKVLNSVNSMLMNRKKFYTILKILSLKNKIKKRKTFLYSVENLIENNLNMSANLTSNFLQKKQQLIIEHSLVHSETNPNKNTIINSPIDISRKEEEKTYENMLRDIPPNPKNRNLRKFIEPPNYNFMPLIANNFFEQSTNKKSVDDLEKKLASLKEVIPPDIIYQNKNQSNDSVCFEIDNIKIDKNNEVTNFAFNQNIYENAKFVFFNKEDNKILFKSDLKDNENDEDNSQLAVLSSENINEISNVIYECKKKNNLEIINSINEGENILKILGPKMNNDNEIKYKYKDFNENDLNDTEFKDKIYIDPESCSIKLKTFNQFNKSEIEGINLKIIQSEIGVDNQSIVDILKDVPGNIYQEIKPENIKDELIFGYTIRLGNLKRIKGDFFNPIDNNDKAVFLEYNKQYFIPKEFFSKDIIIENYCLPKYYLSGKEDLSEDEIAKLGQFLSPVKIGYVKLNYDELTSSNKFEYPIKNNDIELPNSFIIIDGIPEKREVQNLAHIKGRDYSIGGHSYLETTINGRFFSDEDENKQIPDDIKNKYLNIGVEDDYIYFRPNNEMSEAQFKNDITNQISDIEYQKIKNNAVYNFIPYCEKYIDEKSLNESQNLKNLTDEQKNFIVRNFKSGDWIYKAPELKVQLLTKNIGVYQNNGEGETKVTQYIYCNGKEKDFDIEKITDDEIVAEKIIPINENCFNIFENDDFYDLKDIDDSDNYQWKLDIKFKDELQMKSFLKLLTLFRKKANENKNIDIDKNEYDMKEIIDFEQKRKGKGSNKDALKAIKIIRSGEEDCIINIAFINFIEDIEFNNEKEKNPHIRFKLIRGLEKGKNSLLTKLEKCSFKNSLLKNEKLKNYIDEKTYHFKKKVRFDIKRYKNGQRMIFLGKNMESDLSCEFKYDFDSIRNYTLIMKLFDDENEKYYSILNILLENDLKICNKYEFPIYKNGVENKIFGCVGVDIYEKVFQGNQLQKYKDFHINIINNPLLLISKNNDYQNNCLFGLYEPNVFRRKILRKINKLGIDPINEKQNTVKSDIVELNKVYEKKCIKKNNDWVKDIQLDKEVYRKKYVLKLLDIQRHEKFLEEYRKSEWESFLQKISHHNDINNLKKEDLIKNKKQTDKLYNLICFGITDKKNRETFYKIFLDIDKLIAKTKEKVRNFINIEDDNLLIHFSQNIENKANIIFSLIDNDCSNLCYLPNSDLKKINSVKKIVKSFYLWAELKIGLKEEKIKYVYFLGILYITYKLYNYFENENLTFLLLIGLSQKIAHFKQQNPLYNGVMNYINLFGLVTKLILEKFQPEIYEKFISLNFPLEFFLSKYLSSLYANYFEDELMMRIFDIIIFESGIEGKFIDDMQYLRVLCAIPITLFEFNKKDILECESVSELESVINNLIFYKFNMNKFKVRLKNNLKEIYVLTGFLDKLGIKDDKLKWDDKRGRIYRLINVHFRPVYLDNVNYLSKIKEQLIRKIHLGNDVYEKYISQINKKDELKSVQKLFKTDFRIILRVSNIQQIYNNEFHNINDFIFEISFDKDVDTFPTKELEINNEELYYETSFSKEQFPNRIFFKLRLKENKENVIANFSYKLSNIELMKITNVILENTEESNKYLLDIIFYKDTPQNFENNNFNYFKSIFHPPNYIHSYKIDEELSSCKISDFFFENKLSNLINNNNKKINDFLISSNYDNNKYEYFRSLNNIIKENNNKSSIQDIEIFLKDDDDINKLIKNWMNHSNISIEEIFYSIALVDKSSCINENINLLYKIAQTKDRFLHGDKEDKLSIDKLKEMIYSLYKRYMVYFSKSDIDRMIDFLIKDERLFNIKYAFIHKEENEEDMNDLIFDRVREYPELFNEKSYQKIFDNIDKQLNNYINYIINNYNITDIPQVILIYILKTILNNSEHIGHYATNKMNRITLVIEKDNLLYKRNFKILYSDSSISSITEIINDSIIYNDSDDNKERENIDKLLLYKKNELNTSSEYSSEKFVTFDKFKKIFFKLPYLSDLLRVSLTHNINNNEFENNEDSGEFNFFKVEINYENDKDNNMSINPNDKESNFFNFYFPLNQNIINSDNNSNINMNKKIKRNDTIYNIIKELIKKLESLDVNNEDAKQKFEVIKHNLNLVDKIKCYIYYYLDENNEHDLKYVKIGYFDSLYSIPILKTKNKVTLKIIFLKENFNLSNSIYLKLKEKGYCKIFYSENKSYFVWKKIKFSNKKKDEENLKGKAKCFKNYEPKLNENDYTLAYNFNY